MTTLVDAVQLLLVACCALLGSFLPPRLVLIRIDVAHEATSTFSGELCKIHEVEFNGVGGRMMMLPAGTGKRSK